MSQHDTPAFGGGDDTFGGFGSGMADAPRTSVMAILALVCALFICLPLAPIGVLLGIFALFAMAGKPHIRGRGMAIAAIVIGLVVSALWAFVIVVAVKYGVPAAKFVTEGPGPALSAGTSGDIASFQGAFRGAGATADPADAQAFLDTLEDRYGSFVAARIDEQSQNQPQPGGATIELPYILDFANTTDVQADVELIFADEQTGEMVLKLGYVKVIDADLGDLRYPVPPATPTGPSAPSTTDGGGGDGTDEPGS